MTAKQWYAIRSHPHQESALECELRARQIEVFFPQIQVKPVNPRARKVRPFFPGYLFLHVDLDETGINLFQRIPYGASLVSFGGQPAEVPSNLIQALQNRLAAGRLEDIGNTESFQPTQTVLVESGPFAGYDAIFDTHLPGTQRVRILLQMLNQRMLPVEINAGQIRPRRNAKGGRR